jgi:hypothetical protein
MPEEGATLFPNGALISYGSTFTMNHLRSNASAASLAAENNPTFERVMPLTFSWSFHRDIQVAVVAPIVTKSRDLPDSSVSATGLGDTLLALKYRFLRRDSKRGTTQASVSFGPKLPTGSSSRRDPAGTLLPVELQPGTGSTDWFFKLNMTYTGLFNIHRLVADPSIGYLRRTKGAQETRMGDELETRLWLHYRPLQTKLVGGEWFIGPTLRWQHTAADSRFGVQQPLTGSDVMSLGVTSYISPRGGLVFWLGIEFPVAQDWNGAAVEQSRQFHFGITKQFVLHR